MALTMGGFCMLEFIDVSLSNRFSR